MQVILDSSLARLGSAPIWGGKKGEFRDWTNRYRVKCEECEIEFDSDYVEASRIVTAAEN